MREGIRWLGYFLLVLIVFVAIVFAAYRIRGPSHAQREALALMEKDYKPTQGRNAFVVFRYMQYDVPDAELDARMAADVADVRQRLAVLADGTPLAEKPSAPRLAEADRDVSLLCEAGAPGCLARVTAEPESVRQALAKFPTMLARDRVFEQSDYYWNEFPRDYRFVINESPDPGQRIWLSAYALRYMDGDHAGALADTCRNIGTWRKIRHGSNSLIGSMIAIAKADGAMRLLAEMLAALPAGEPVPDECGAALRPIETADIDRCGEMAGEFAMSRSVEDELSRNGASWTDRAETWLMFDARQTQAWRAEQYAQYCGDSAVRRMLDDHAMAPGIALAPVMRRAECIASVTGCMLADIASPAYSEFDARTLDFAAHLRLAATLLWLRDAAAQEPVAQRFDERPPALRSGRRASGFDSATGMLFVDNLHQAHGARFELPVRTP